jgi:hypothetical protein
MPLQITECHVSKLPRSHSALLCPHLSYHYIASKVSLLLRITCPLRRAILPELLFSAVPSKKMWTIRHKTTDRKLAQTWASVDVFRFRVRMARRIRYSTNVLACLHLIQCHSIHQPQHTRINTLQTFEFQCLIQNTYTTKKGHAFL